MIGIIGGYGDVGLQAARTLQAWGQYPLRLGGRNPAGARASLEAEFPRAEWAGVDIEDHRSLASFLAGCRLIVNCAGPSHRTAARVAEICLAEGCHHVDAGVDKSLAALRGTPQNTAVVYAAGAVPGLSGLLPRWLAKSFERVETLVFYSGALDGFTASAAEDYLAGVADRDNEPLAAWKNGARRPAALRRRTGTALPFFPRQVTLYPYLDAEAELVAVSLALRDGEWYMAVDGSHVPPVLEAVSAQFAADPRGAVGRLGTAAGLDAAGRRKYINLLVQLGGIKDGAPAVRTLVLRAGRPSVLTGAVAAAAGIAVLEGEIPPGVRSLAELPDPDRIMVRLNGDKAVSRLQVLESSVDELLQGVEGEV